MAERPPAVPGRSKLPHCETVGSLESTRSQLHVKLVLKDRERERQSAHAYVYICSFIVILKPSVWAHVPCPNAHPLHEPSQPPASISGPRSHFCQRHTSKGTVSVRSEASAHIRMSRSLCGRGHPAVFIPPVQLPAGRCSFHRRPTVTPTPFPLFGRGSVMRARGKLSLHSVAHLRFVWHPARARLPQ